MDGASASKSNRCARSPGSPVGIHDERRAPVKPFTRLAVAVFAVVAIVHLMRLIIGWEVVVSGFVVPLWWSGPALVITGGLALMLWREAHT